MAFDRSKLRSKWQWGVASETRRGLMLGMGYTDEELAGFLENYDS